MMGSNSNKPASSGEVSDRRADELAGKGSFADALKRARKAKERGDLQRAREIMAQARRDN